MGLSRNIYVTAIGWYGDVDDDDCPSNGKMPSPTVEDPLVLTMSGPTEEDDSELSERISDSLADMYHIYPATFLYRKTKPGGLIPKEFNHKDAFEEFLRGHKGDD